MKSADTIRRDLTVALPAGSGSDAVLAYLDREKIEHSQLSAAGLSKGHKPAAGEQVIHAAMRKPAGAKTVSRAVTIEFRFGADRRLASIAVRDQFTGP